MASLPDRGVSRGPQAKATDPVASMHPPGPKGDRTRVNEEPEYSLRTAATFLASKIMA